jgi:hypothetical protein
VRAHRGEPELDAMEFMTLVNERLQVLHIDQELLKRPVNEGFSGGEKKRNEIFQMLVLQPRSPSSTRPTRGSTSTPEDGRRGRERHAIPRPRHRRRDALPAAAQLHRAGLRARAERRTHRQVGRQGPGAPPRGPRLRVVTSVAPIAETAFRLAGPANGAARQLSQASAFSDVWRVVVANGRMDASLSDLNGLPDGLEISGLAEAIAGRGGELEGRLGQIASMQDRAFAALNGAFLHDGVFIAVRRGTIVERPIHLVFVTSADGAPVMAHPRVFVSVGEGAQLRVIETYVGEGARYLTNVVAEYDLSSATTPSRCSAARAVDCTLNGLYLGDGSS